MSTAPFRFRSKSVFILAAAVVTVGFAVWPGCITPPLPAKRTPIAGRERADFRSKNTRHLTRAEVIERLGPPDAYLPDIRVALYRVNQSTRRNVWLLFFVIPVQVVSRPGVDFAFIQFDADDRVERFELSWNYDSQKLDQVAREWLQKKPAQPQPPRQKAPAQYK